MSDIVFDLEQRHFPLGKYTVAGGRRDSISSYEILNAKLAEVKHSMQQLGLRNIDIYHPTEADAPTTPILYAMWGGDAVYICFPEYAEDLFGINSIPLAAANYFERNMPNVIVCHAAFFFQYLSSGTEVDMLGCRPVRAHGVWQNLPGWDDHLPFEKRQFIPKLDAVLGPLALTKNSQLQRDTMMHGEIVDFAVEGLYGPDESADSPFKIMMHPCTPHYMLRGKLNPSTGEFENGGPCINMEYPEQLSEVRLKDIYRNHGVLVLTDKNGVEMNAKCLEFYLLPQVFRAGQRFLGNVALFAYLCHVTPKQMVESRRFAAKSGCEMATATGRVESTEWLDLGFTKLMFITLQCMPDNEDFHLHVYARPEALRGFRPKPGDTVTCSGYVQFVCTQLVL